MKIGQAKHIGLSGGLAAALLLVAFALPARAADPVYPAASAVGLVPPAGMVPSKAFSGFEDPAKNAVIIMTTLPAPAYGELEKNQVDEVLKNEGITVEKREPFDLKLGKAFVITGKQTVNKINFRDWLLIVGTNDITVLVRVHAPEDEKTYSDTVVRAALATVSLRTAIPDAERLSLVPFKIGNLAGFRIEDVMPGRALMLVEPAPGETGLNGRLLIAAIEGGPAEPDDRANFARLAFQQIGGIKDVQLTMSEPLRIGSQPGFQTTAKAKGAQTGLDLMVVQWLRFGTGGFIQMVGMGRTDKWSDLFERMRTVRDSIDPK
jgi:hypothetical protein